MLASAEPVAHADRTQGADCPGRSVLVPAVSVTHEDQTQGALSRMPHWTSPRPSVTAQRTLSLPHWVVIPPVSPTTWSVGP